MEDQIQRWYRATGTPENAKSQSPDPNNEYSLLCRLLSHQSIYSCVQLLGILKDIPDLFWHILERIFKTVRIVLLPFIHLCDTGNLTDVNGANPLGELAVRFAIGLRV